MYNWRKNLNNQIRLNKMMQTIAPWTICNSSEFGHWTLPLKCTAKKGAVKHWKVNVFFYRGCFPNQSPNGWLLGYLIERNPFATVFTSKSICSDVFTATRQMLEHKCCKRTKVPPIYPNTTTWDSHPGAPCLSVCMSNPRLCINCQTVRSMCHCLAVL